jgi:hypothetical protein
MPSLKKRTSQQRVPALSSDRTTKDGALWSPVVATGGNRSQIRRAAKRLKSAETVATGCHRLPESFHGKEGVDGSSPSEGSAKSPELTFLSSDCLADDAGLLLSPAADANRQSSRLLALVRAAGHAANLGRDARGTRTRYPVTRSKRSIVNALHGEGEAPVRSILRGRANGSVAEGPPASGPQQEACEGRRHALLPSLPRSSARGSGVVSHRCALAWQR